MPFVSREISCPADSLELSRRVYGGPFSAHLISGLSGHPHSKQSIFAAVPFLIFDSAGRNCRWIDPATDRVEIMEGNPFDIFYERWTHVSPSFAIGYWGYDLKDHLEKLDDRAKREFDGPDAQWMLFHAVARIDHVSGRVVVEGTEDAVDRLQEKILSDSSPVTGSVRLYSVRPQWTRSDYIHAVRAIREHIRVGDAYEVNLTQRFFVDAAPSAARDLELLQTMLSETPSPFTAMLRSPAMTILSSSPERFLRIDGHRMECEPIKGTRPRGRSFDDDEAAYLSLVESEKDRAENLMIVDLTRNDLGRVAEIGSVAVPRLFHIDAYQTVFQMSSTIEAQLAAEFNWMDAVKAAFPPGSMTGAPKIAAMNIIESLEPVKRQVYSGVLGYVDWTGNVDLSVIIRTLVLHGGSGYFQTGGAIVWDSDAESEYQECWDKAEGILRTLQTWRDGY